MRGDKGLGVANLKNMDAFGSNQDLLVFDEKLAEGKQDIDSQSLMEIQNLLSKHVRSSKSLEAINLRNNNSRSVSQNSNSNLQPKRPKRLTMAEKAILKA